MWCSTIRTATRARSRLSRKFFALGRRATAFQANFENVDDVLRLGSQAIEFLGGIDCLVNNAGITFNKPFLKVTPQQYDTVFNVNIRAQFFLTQTVAAHMVEHGGGAVCNLTSVHGLQGAPEHAVYAATKGAIIAFTRTLGIEMAHKGSASMPSPRAGWWWRIIRKFSPGTTRKRRSHRHAIRCRSAARISRGDCQAGAVPLFR